MTPQVNRARSVLAAIAMIGGWLAAMAGPVLAQESDWPCEQALRPDISLGAIWSGPDVTGSEEKWADNPAVTALVAQIAPRKMPQADAIEAIHRFAAGYANDRPIVLAQVFAGLFDTLNHERSDIIRGIRRFNVRQANLSKRIEEGWRNLDALDPNSTDAAVAEQRFAMQQAIDWDSRVFDDRQKLLPEICQQPVIIEQRLFALSRAIQSDLAAGSQ